ncbi:hypothetical protein Bca101_041109 [Brassica carinata]
MKEKGHYVPPSYIPLSQSEDADAEVTTTPNLEGADSGGTKGDDPVHWSSGIYACFDDTQSCFIGPCLTHCVSWALINTICCFATSGVLLGLPGCFMSCYACGYRRSLRAKYNLEEAPCGDCATHFFCHLCAICQEYREIRERGSNPPDMKMAITDATLTQTMESAN